MLKIYLWITEDEKPIVERVCKDIFIKDDTFLWTMFKDKGREGMFVLSISSPDIDIAHMRGVWFINKVPISNKFYKVEGNIGG